MCPRCVVDPNLSRGRLCADSGSYNFNMGVCQECKSTKKDVRIQGRSEEDEGDMEVVTYNHTCSSCGHLVAEHRHEFWVEDGYQEYRMDCLLCGIGEDSTCVMPRDPRKASAYSEM